MKKIAMILPTLAGGGAERITLNLARTLVLMGNEVHIILLADIISYTVDKRLCVHTLSKRGKITGQKMLDRWLLGRRLRHLIKKLSTGAPFDLIISNLLDADYLVSRQKLDNVYYVIHNTTSKEIGTRGSPARQTARKKKIERVYGDKNLVCVSDGVKEDLLNVVGVRPRSCRTIYNPFDFQEIISQSRDSSVHPPADEYIIHVGRIHRQKRIDILLRAFTRVREPVKLVMLAQPTPELLDMISNEGLSDRVILPGFQANPYPWMRKARLLVLSSEYEGLPTVIIEALICGVPVVSTDCPSGPREILGESLRHWLVPTNDPVALAHRINEALATKIDLSLINLEKFAINHVAQQYLALRPGPDHPGNSSRHPDCAPR